MPDYYPVPLLLKLGVMASIASILARFNPFKSLLMLENRTLHQRVALSLWLAVVFGASVATGVFLPNYKVANLGLEGSLLAGLIGGYVTGLLSGILISLPAVPGDHVALPVLAGIGVFGGLLRDLAPDPEEIWRFSFFDLSIYRFFKESRYYRRASFHLLFFVGILLAEAVRQGLHRWPVEGAGHGALATAAQYLATVFAIFIPLKIWNSMRNEKKLEEQERLLAEARLAALTSQINPHFLFNTLNSVSSLIRTNPDQARLMVGKLSAVLRRLLRKHEHFSTLRDELSFIEDYLSIEVMRFGDKLVFEKDVAEDTLDMLVPSMLLQPLVENCIKHGLSSKVEGGTIRIRTRRAEAKLSVLVEDDGTGIAESKLATLLDRGIGVSNVNERLKVLFGNQYRMWIDSQAGHGTRIQIEVPELQTDLAAAG
ncbi:MAG TPA: histidine kinase [Bryobacteraceae bacterium]|nr:histidine kinase [Bryobacteraceae bacterium]HZU25276.1 histidine kinase [Bryobacteraceae bacterium]